MLSDGNLILSLRNRKLGSNCVGKGVACRSGANEASVAGSVAQPGNDQLRLDDWVAPPSASQLHSSSSEREVQGDKFATLALAGANIVELEQAGAGEQRVGKVLGSLCGERWMVLDRCDLCPTEESPRSMFALLTVPDFLSRPEPALPTSPCQSCACVSTCTSASFYARVTYSNCMTRTVFPFSLEKAAIESCEL
ncbi:hypothetical protein NDU88_007830 [Pleurodeles waltl]|uniref:Uncharacterized protein n=1 Tax=Pleurodeles waltl TaxID=8319 RepID=A0AAV7RS29_PLEWA|nr:hypothetical protein NDU88_007830 [Pleurodeles waltl]